MKNIILIAGAIGLICGLSIAVSPAKESVEMTGGTVSAIEALEGQF